MRRMVATALAAALCLSLAICTHPLSAARAREVAALVACRGIKLLGREIVDESKIGSGHNDIGEDGILQICILKDCSGAVGTG